MNILLVSSDEQFVNIVSFALSLKGHGVLVAKSGSEARTIIDSSKDIINAVAIDLILANPSNGLELARMVRVLNSEIPIYLIAPFKDHSLEQEARHTGCKDVVLKPVAIDELLRKLGRNP